MSKPTAIQSEVHTYQYFIYNGPSMFSYAFTTSTFCFDLLTMAFWTLEPDSKRGPFFTSFMYSHSGIRTRCCLLQEINIISSSQKRALTRFAYPGVGPVRRSWELWACTGARNLARWRSCRWWRRSAWPARSEPSAGCTRRDRPGCWWAATSWWSRRWCDWATRTAPEDRNERRPGGALCWKWKLWFTLGYYIQQQEASKWLDDSGQIKCFSTFSLGFSFLCGNLW